MAREITGNLNGIDALELQTTQRHFALKCFPEAREVAPYRNGQNEEANGSVSAMGGFG